MKRSLFAGTGPLMAECKWFITATWIVGTAEYHVGCGPLLVEPSALIPGASYASPARAEKKLAGSNVVTHVTAHRPQAWQGSKPRVHRYETEASH
jgi:hypothetical protein